MYNTIRIFPRAREREMCVLERAELAARPRAFPGGESLINLLHAETLYLGRRPQFHPYVACILVHVLR